MTSLPAPEVVLAAVGTGFAVRALWRLAHADGDLSIPSNFQWLFPLRGKWLYRGIVGLLVGLFLPAIFLVLYGIVATLSWVFWSAVALSQPSGS